MLSKHKTIAVIAVFFIVIIPFVVLLVLRPGDFRLSFQAGQKSGQIDYKVQRQAASEKTK